MRLPVAADISVAEAALVLVHQVRRASPAVGRPLGEAPVLGRAGPPSRRLPGQHLHVSHPGDEVRAPAISQPRVGVQVYATRRLFVSPRRHHRSRVADQGRHGTSLSREQRKFVNSTGFAE